MKRKNKHTRKEEESNKYKMDLIAWLVLIIVILGLLIILLWGIPDREYYPGKPKLGNTY